MRLVLAILLLLGAGLPARAWAHASLLATEPADASRLDRAPGEIRLRFDEPVGLISLRLVGPGGAAIAPLAPPAVDGSVLHASYPRDLKQGGYVLSYRVTSADSHPVAGAISFGIGAAAPGGVAQGAESVWTIPYYAARFLFYGSTILAAGGALFRALVAGLGARTRRMLSWAGIAALALAGLQVGLRGALLAGGPWDSLFQVASWRLAASTTLASSLGLTALGLIGCTLALRQDRAMLGAAGAVAVAAGFALSGHTATADPRWLAAPAVFLHVLTATLWLGALLPLWIALGGAPGPAARAARRFSQMAVPAVGLLILCGLALATIQLERPSALVTTFYGLLLCGKLALLAGLLGLAAWNRNRLTPALLAGRHHAAWTMRASIAGESVLAAAVLLLTSVLTFTPPPRVQPRAPGMVLVMGMEGNVMAHFAVSPARPGPNRIDVTLLPAVPQAKEAWLELSQPAAGLGPLRRKLEPDGAGGWETGNADLFVDGRWTLKLELLVTDYEQLSISADLDVP